jgi:hypothetical protein
MRLRYLLGPGRSHFSMRVTTKVNGLMLVGYVIAKPVGNSLTLRLRGKQLRQDWNPLQLYEDLYLTEQPYGFVSGVATDLPDND